jgi:hypothetical protein
MPKKPLTVKQLLRTSKSGRKAAAARAEANRRLQAKAYSLKKQRKRKLRPSERDESPVIILNKD